MLIGTMNHPARDLMQEIAWMAETGFQFLDLTLEPPKSAVWQIDPLAVRDELRKHGMPVVGHTAYYLPLCSPFEAVRQAAVAELRRCLTAFATIGARWMNVHPATEAAFHDRAFVIKQNTNGLRELIDIGHDHGVGIMIENLPGSFNNAKQLGELLEPLPELGLHLDIGHANLGVPKNTTAEILKAHGSRLRHVHLHDNRGHDDLHLPLGAGTVDVAAHIRTLRSYGYDGTITLEVFTPDRHHLTYSRDLLARLWKESDSVAAAA